MVNRITLTLEQIEYSGLLEIALGELRTPQEQLRYLLRQELVRRGLLPIQNGKGDSHCQMQSTYSHKEDV